MILQVDKQGENAIQQLCDSALRQGGINNLNQVNLILHKMEVIITTDKIKNDPVIESKIDDNAVTNPEESFKSEDKSLTPAKIEPEPTKE